VEATGVELITILITRNLLILGTATTAKKAPSPDPLYVYCTKIRFALQSNRHHMAATVSRTPFQVSSLPVSRRDERSSSRDSLAISRLICAFTITPHSSLHRWQYRAPQGKVPLLGLSRISLLLCLCSAVIPCVSFFISRPLLEARLP